MDSSQGRHLGQVNDLPAGDMNVVKAGDREILLINTGSGIFALENRCIHGGCSLLHGKLEGETLRCLCHGSVFDVRTGSVIDGPAARSQPAYALLVENGEIFLAR